MAHVTTITSGGLTFPVTEFDSTAQQIDDAVANMGAAPTPQAALANLGAGVRQNELDNAYFVGGGTEWGVFPVNQRGVSGTISSPGYFIDRWKLVSGTVEITSAGLVLNGTIAQIIPASIGAVYSAVALTTTGLVTCDYTDSTRTFSITGSGQTFLLAKLEAGANQTAAYQTESGSWTEIPGQRKSYSAEFLACIQYRLTAKNQVLAATIFSSAITAFIPTPITMQGTNVDITIDENSYIYGPSTTALLEASNVTTGSVQANGVSFSANCALSGNYAAAITTESITISCEP